MKKLTKREKLIIGVATIAMAGISIKLNKEVFKAHMHYNILAGKLCSGGTWKATDITKNSFKLVVVNCCGGCK
jgi:hypothetical protein